MARIFVINDEPDLMEACAMTLEEEGHEVIQVTDMTPVAKVAETLRPDLVLVDLVMPGMDGEQVIRELRSSEVAGLLIVAMSALFDGRARAMRAGADDFLPKPFGRDVLIRTVDRVLRSAQRYAHKSAS